MEYDCLGARRGLWDQETPDRLLSPEASDLSPVAPLLPPVHPSLLLGRELPSLQLRTGAAAGGEEVAGGEECGVCGVGGESSGRGFHQVCAYRAGRVQEEIYCRRDRAG